MHKTSLLFLTLFTSLLSAENCQTLVPSHFEKGAVDLLISHQEIQNKILEVGEKLHQEYGKEEVVVLMVMKGALCIGSDFIRLTKLPCTVEFIQASSYGQGGTKRGELTLQGFDKLNIENKHVLVIDDIFDSGATLSGIVEQLKKKHPKTIKSLVLLLKNAPKVTNYSPDYALFPIDDEFVIGYGLDYKEFYRGLDGIYIYRPED